MDLRLSADLARHTDWHEVQFQWCQDTAPRLTLRALARLRPFRVILVRRRQLRDGKLLGPEQEWTWPPRRPAPAEA